MIARLKGELADRNPGTVVVMAGGVGYEVHIPLSTYYDLPDQGDEVSFHIKTVVREDAIELFGFLTRAEREAFLLLNSVSKIGPRLALSFLSGLNPAELVAAVSRGDVARLSSVPGVGAKTAQRVCLELKDKIAALAGLAGAEVPVAPAAADLDDVGRDVVSALTNLGYTRTEAEKTVGRVQVEEPDAVDISTLLRLCLKKLRKV